jgi:cytochrome c oxidase subunit 2
LAGQPTSSKPQVIAPKGLGPFFWPYTLLLTVISLVIAGGILFANLDWLLPGWSNPVTDRAGDVDNLFKFMGVFGAWIFIYVAGYVVYFAVVFRRRADEPANSIGVQVHDSPNLEFWWTYVPIVLLIGLVVMSTYIWGKIFFPTEAPGLTMEVVGHQFDFEYRYPGVATSLYSPKDEMHLPVGVPVRVLLSSADVLHQFWVPEFRVKLATVPGLVQDMNFTPLRTGTFDIACSEYCGVAHSKMQGKVVVESQADFNKWLSALKGHSALQGTVSLAKGDPAAGKTVFAAKCAACHAVGPFDQKVVGPGLKGLTDDAAHPNLVTGKAPTPDNIAAILENGYAGPIGNMPNEQANGLSSTDVANLVAYLVSLK